MKVAVSKKIKISALLVVAVLSFGSFLFFGGKPAGALTGSDFKAGRIIDDYTFFNSTTMTSSEIQTFLNAKVPTCDTNGTTSITYWWNSTTGYASASTYQSGSSQVTTSRATYGSRYDAYNGTTTAAAPYTCLKDYTTSTPSVAGDAYCSQINGGTRSAAQIIGVISSACHINPQSLIVTLQKEQGIVTDDWPWQYEYKFATGFCVYDTTPPPSCSGTDGFFNQVYYAARQFQRYMKDPNRASYFNYFAGQTSNIAYSTDGSCGSSSVYIQNNATAGLYNYTPYQPNSNVLNNTYPTGDSRGPGPSVSCGAYGNRNFWWYFNTWFGSTVGPFYYLSSQTNPPASLEYGHTSTATIVITNNSTQTWYSDDCAAAQGVNPFRLMVLGYRNTAWADTGATVVSNGSSHLAWMGPANQVRMIDCSVAPGAQATFTIPLKAPQYQTSEIIYFCLVQDGVQVHDDRTLSFKITSVPDYAYSIVSDNVPPGILPGDGYQFTIKLKNTGGETWYNDANKGSAPGGHPIRLATSGYTNSPFSYPGLGAGWLTQNQITMVEPSVAPGATGTFQAVIFAPYEKLAFNHGFRLVLDGVKFISGPTITSTISIPQPVASYQIISHSGPSIMKSGQEATFKVVIKNTGNMIWRNLYRKVPSTSTQKPLRDVRMMSWAPGYHTSYFWDWTPEWMGTHNQLTPSTAIAGPGQTATYNITFRAPPVSKTTFFNEQWTLVLDGQTVMPFQGLTFPITVTP